MRVTYRQHDIKDYWTSRWNDAEVDQYMFNNIIYPIKYADIYKFSLFRSAKHKIFEENLARTEEYQLLWFT